MPNYYKKTNKRGNLMYYQDSKLVAFKDIPEFAVIIDRDFEVLEPIEHPRSALDAVNDGLNADVFIEGYKPTVTLETVDAPPPPAATVIEHDPSLCLACGAPAECARFVNLQTVHLCEEHYRSMTLGEVVQTLREKQPVT